MKLIFSVIALLFVTDNFAQKNCHDQNSITNVKKRKAGRTEYVIFTLKNPVTATHLVSDTVPPFGDEDNSKLNVHVRGCKYKAVQFRSVFWTCRTPITSGNTYLIRDVKNSEQFEGYITYIIGYRCNTGSIVSYEYQDGDYTKVVVRLKY